MNCETCNNPHTGTFGSGRFCNQSCASSFSTRLNRAEISAKISNALIGRKIRSYVRSGKNVNCPICRDAFYLKPSSNTIYCSWKCYMSDELKSDRIDYSKSGGLRDGGGYSKLIEYISHSGEHMKLNADEAEVAKVLDQLGITWIRNWNGFEYVTKFGITRNYYPDFYIETFDCYVEYKGYVTSDMKHKMDNAQLLNPNLNLIIVYSDDKRYRDMGLNLSEIKNNPKKLLAGLV